MDIVKIFNTLQPDTNVNLISKTDNFPNSVFNAVCGNKTPAIIKNNAILKIPLERLQKEADAFSRKEIPVIPFSLYKLFDTNGDRLAYENCYFERRKRLTVLALSSWLWEKQEYIAFLEDTVWSICEEYSWCLPAHMGGKSLCIENDFSQSQREHLDLFACETGFALAETIGMLAFNLHSAVIKRAKDEIMRRIIRSYVNKAEPLNWELMKNNWSAVCAAGIACAAMYLIEDDKVLADILNSLQPAFNNFISSFSADGTCTEGLSYWTYGVGFYTCYADMLFHRTKGAVNVFNESGFSNIAKFQQYCYFPCGATLNFSDVNEKGKFRQGLSCYLANKIEGVYAPQLNLSDYRGLIDNCGRFSMALRDLIWTDDSTAKAVRAQHHPAQISQCVRVTALPDAQWLLCSGASQTGFAAKGGHNDEPHNHNDVGSFIFFKNGVMLLCDIGSGEYTKDYFSDKRYEIFCNSSLGHNLPVIAGQGQKAGKKFASGNCVINNDGSMNLDIAPAYDIAGLDKLERRFRFDINSGVLTLCDNFVFTQIQPLAERFILPAEPQITKDGCSLVFNSASVSISCVDKASGENVKPVVSKVNYRDHEGNDAHVFTVDFNFRPAENIFSVEFVIS